MKKILIIEDDIKLRKYIQEYLIGYNYEVEVVTTFDNIEDDVTYLSPDLILLDINLPKFDGFYFLTRIKKNTNIPIIIVSARSSDADQIHGIEMGADDYITKPFNIGILVTRIKAVLRRTSSSELKSIKFQNMTLMCEAMQLKIDEKIIELSRNEYKLLKIFMINNNKVVSREKLLEALWDDMTFVDNNTLTVNITRLKKKLINMKVKATIITKRGIGYVFK